MPRSFLLSALALFWVLLAAPRPAAQDLGVTSPLFENLTAVPGQTYQRVLSLENLSDTVQRARITQVDYVSGPDGASYYPIPEDQAHPRSNAAWIALPRTSIVVPADTTIDVPYSLTVPTGLAPTGTYWSVLMVEPVTTAAPIDAGVGNVQIRIANRYRYAVHIAATIGDHRPAVSFETPRLLDEGASRALNVDLRNEGASIVQPDIWMELYGADGAPAGRFDARPRPVYPASVATTSIDLATLPGGRYSGILYVDAGGDELLGSRLAFDLTDMVPPEPDSETAAPSDRTQTP